MTPFRSELINYDDYRNGIARCATLLERALKTLRALPDNDRRAITNSWPDFVRDPLDAYGYTEARPPRFRPTPKDVSVMLEVLARLSWLDRQVTSDGPRDVKIIVARAYGSPWWRLAQRFGRSERTVQRWHDGAVTRIYSTFMAEVEFIAA